MAVSAVWRLVHFLAPYPSDQRSKPQHTGQTPVPLSKSPKGIGFWYKSFDGRRDARPISKPFAPLVQFS